MALLCHPAQGAVLWRSARRCHRIAPSHVLLLPALPTWLPRRCCSGSRAASPRRCHSGPRAVSHWHRRSIVPHSALAPRECARPPMPSRKRPAAATGLAQAQQVLQEVLAHVTQHGRLPSQHDDEEKRLYFRYRNYRNNANLDPAGKALVDQIQAARSRGRHPTADELENVADRLAKRKGSFGRNDSPGA